MSKKLILFTCCILSSICAYSQCNNRNPNRDNKRYFWGITFSGTQAKNKVIKSDYFFHQTPDSIKAIRSSTQAGGAFGINASVRPGKYTEIKSGVFLHLHQRNLEFDFFKRSTVKTKMETVSLDFPLDFKYRSAMPCNTRMFVVAGLRYSHDYQSNEGLTIGATSPKVYSKKNTFYYQFGAGFEFRLEFVDVGIELKMANAFTNALVKTDVDPNNIYNKSIAGLYPRLFSFSLFVYN